MSPPPAPEKTTAALEAVLPKQYWVEINALARAVRQTRLAPGPRRAARPARCCRCAGRWVLPATVEMPRTDVARCARADHFQIGRDCDHRVGDPAGDRPGSGPLQRWLPVDSIRISSTVSLRLRAPPAPVKSHGEPTAQTAQAAWDGHGGSRAAWRRAARLRRSSPGRSARPACTSIGFRFPGQTEFFAARCGGGGLRHAPDRRNSLTVALVQAPICRCSTPSGGSPGRRSSGWARLLAEFPAVCGLGRPVRVAVAGLNPHAGENGNLGREEIDVIAPAIRGIVRELRKHGRQRATFHGPVPPDTVFYQAGDRPMGWGALHVPRPGADPA